MPRIKITRAQFEEQFGYKPDPSTLGMVFVTAKNIPLVEYVFTDEPLVSEAPLEVAELERIWRLQSA